MKMTYAFKHGMPSADPNILASFIVHENSDPKLRGSEDTCRKFASSGMIYNQIKQNWWKHHAYK